MNLTLAHDVLFDTDEPLTGDTLLAAATSLATGRPDTPSELVIVIRPGTDECVVAGGTQSVLRAAVSVSAAVDPTPLWSGIPAGDTIEIPTTSLSDRVATAAAAAGSHAVHAGRVEVDGTDQAVAIWFETSAGVDTDDHRRRVLAALADAAARAEVQRREAALAAEAQAAAAAAEAPPAGRQFDSSDPDLDTATGLLAGHRFHDEAFDLFCDEAGVVVIVVGDGSADVTDDAARYLADRLVDAFDRSDLLARLSADRFVVVAANAERSTLIGRARSLLDTLVTDEAAPIASIALSHEVGLVDIEEMLDVAGSAAAAGRGESKFVLAA